MNLAVMVSGTGSILEAMIEGGLPIKLVVADRPCRGIEIAREQQLANHIIDRKQFGFDVMAKWDRRGFTRMVAEVLLGYNIELVAMAGFMTVLAQPMFDVYAGRILNTHPSLLPAFKGERAVEDALEYGVKITGCTIHIATMELDAGPILAQVAVPIEPSDDKKSLHERIKIEERKLYQSVIWQIVKGEIEL